MANLIVMSRSDLKKKEVIPAGTVIRTVFYNISTCGLAEKVDTLTLGRNISGADLNSVLKTLVTAAEVRTLGFTLEDEESVVNRNMLVRDKEIIIIDKYHCTMDMFETVDTASGVSLQLIKAVL